ncbi:inositol monophosphatase [Fodinisporobacter ferrooxydans]|uniref:Inositol-1-monophosphatase n=1 Tax=Fodinisporobacter ferrooxydans TaxID=2901836 RepID=A0ABY4CGE6_9BACL|nr:inositol monophosphatase [Alicyclobacillaceae bacterium MYW30-H2]
MNFEKEESSLLEAAIRYAKDAGQLIRERMNGIQVIEMKKNRSDLVTEVDRYSEEFLRRIIHREYPEHWILSEEDNGQADSFQAFVEKGPGCGWIIDPIDGTTNFIHGIPHFAVSIGIVREWAPIVGVVYNPVTDELFYARKNAGAFRNGEKITVSAADCMEDALLATGFQALEWKPDTRLLKQMNALTGTCRSFRLLGAASLDLCWTASGQLTGFWHDGLHPWDAAAGIVIVREAGGKVTNRDGAPYSLRDNTLVASNSRIHEEFLAVITR